MEPPAERHRVDAVICTRNRPDKIAHAVASVLACDHPSFSVTVVDQSTSDDTRRALEELLVNDRRLRYHHSDEPGLSRAYNTAVALTTADVLAFTDDDCLVPSDWLSAIESAFEREPSADLLYGQVLPLVRSPEDTSLVPWLPIERRELMGPGTKFRVFGMGANFAARRRLFERFGPFDEILGGGAPLRSSQDYDLAYRTWRGGGTIILVPEVHIEHDGRREREDWPALLDAYGIGDGAFYSKHVRCRDAYATWMFARHLATAWSRFAFKLLMRRRPGNLRYLTGVNKGVREAMKYNLDRDRRLYRPRSAGV